MSSPALGLRLRGVGGEAVLPRVCGCGFADIGEVSANGSSGSSSRLGDRLSLWGRSVEPGLGSSSLGVLGMTCFEDERSCRGGLFGDQAMAGMEDEQAPVEQFAELDLRLMP